MHENHEIYKYLYVHILFIIYIYNIQLQLQVLFSSHCSLHLLSKLLGIAPGGLFLMSTLLGSAATQAQLETQSTMACG